MTPLIIESMSPVRMVWTFVAQDSPDHYHVVQHVDTFGGKTSIYVPSIGRFFVVHTKGDLAKEAGLQVFKVN
jgi:hypothetical protein